jgi:3-hydroxy acid dehydrogenase / malonic semialdehyde reductase
MNRFRLDGITSLITGATSGIGLAIAKQFAASGSNLILTGRRRDRLLTIKDDLEANYGVSVRIFDFDVRLRASCEAFVSQLGNIDIDILVNNAGLARGIESVDQALVDDWDEMIDTNVKGLLYMSRLILPRMLERNSGHVLNIGSIAGHEAYRGGVGYCATKHAVSAINAAMKMDLTGTAIRVSMISPGLVNTEFSTIRFHGDTDKADNVYKGMQPLVGDDIADIALFIVTRPKHVDIIDVLVYPTAQSSAYLVHRQP